MSAGCVHDGLDFLSTTSITCDNDVTLTAQFMREILRYPAELRNYRDILKSDAAVVKPCRFNFDNITLLSQQRNDNEKWKR